MRTFFSFGSVLQSEIPINQRIAILIESFAEGKQRRFAEAIGVSPSAISDIFGKRQNTPSTEMLQKIAAAYNQISMDWLIAGYGPMLKSFHDDEATPQDEVESGFETLSALRDTRHRLVYLRQIWGLSTAEAAKAVGISEEELSDIEAGKTNATFQTLHNLGILYRTSTHYLEAGEDINQHLLKELGIEILTLRDKVSASASRGDMPLVTVDTAKQENIVLVSTQAATSYPTRYLEPEYYKELPAFSIPLPQLRNATFRAFQVSGASMVPTFYPGGWVIARYQDHKAEEIQGDWPYVIVTKDGVLIKRVSGQKHDSSALSLQSDNDEYQAYDLPIGDVLELWQVTADIGFQFPARKASLIKKVEAIESWMRGFGIENPDRFKLHPIEPTTKPNWPAPPSKSSSRQTPSKGSKGSNKKASS